MDAETAGRGTFLVSKLAIPYLSKSANPHILMLSPPLDLDPRWFAPHVAYTISKFGMSLCVLGLAEELRPRGIAVNALWPRTMIATAAIANVIGGPELMQRCRHPAIVADAAYHVLTAPSRDLTGRFLIDEDFLRERGVVDFELYRVDPSLPLQPDFFVPGTLPLREVR